MAGRSLLPIKPFAGEFFLMKYLVPVAALLTTCLTTPAFAQTAAEADAFVARAEKELLDFSNRSQPVSWVQETYVMYDTNNLLAKVNEEGAKLQVNLALEAAKYDAVPGLSAETKRKLIMLRSTITLPAPTSEGGAEQLAKLAVGLGAAYAEGKGTLRGKEVAGSDLEAEMGTNRNPDELKEMWTSWHDNVGAPMREDYVKLAGVANAGAKELGYPDVGALWRSNYDMSPTEFAALTDKLWLEVKPLYDELHTFVRTKLNAKYGDTVQPKTGPIRADLLGNMWAQEWGDIYDLVAPPGSGEIGYDIGQLLKDKGFTPTDPNEEDKEKRGKSEIEMVKIGEGFFSSLGFEPLPKTFYERSQFLKPRDREVQCHASAWDLDNKDDLRIKMCIKVNTGDFVTIHHELGHNYYQRAYNDKSYLYLNGANDGFHEAIGDAVALSITPEYLVQIGLLDRAKVPGADKDNGLLLRQAMDKVAFLPFGLLMDRWRWGVYDGSIPADGLNKGWNNLRLKYQGIVPPVPRDESKFDAGAKYHIPNNVPYTRYFLARILQFQFYKAACDAAGWKGPLHRCSFYGNKDVGTKLNAMLEMGASKPWPDALEAFTGSREMSGTAMIEYFKPLMEWLKKENKGAKKGW
jgi:peptidyl-dipeptidase A